MSALVLGVASVLLLVSSSPRASTRLAAAVPAPVEPGLDEPKPRRLGDRAHTSRWAPVIRAATARAGPARSASVVAHLSTRTAEGTTNIVSVLGHRAVRGRLWIHVRLPVLPNDRTAWVPRAALGGYGTVRTHLVVDLEALRATLYRSGQRIFAAPIGVGAPAWPTPRGSFYIRSKLTDFASPMYGPIAFGTSARSSVLTDWPAGGFIGIHGTNEPDLLPGRVSHGCIRMANHDILRLARHMPVGTPISIR
jgi:lipoprotein-anchoring transpeptidase ErfK/SrfK